MTKRHLLNPLNAKLNPICHLLALLGAHHILHVSRMRVKEKETGLFVRINFQMSSKYLVFSECIPQFFGYDSSTHLNLQEVFNVLTLWRRNFLLNFSTSSI